MCWNEAFLWGTPFSQCGAHGYKLSFTHPDLALCSQSPHLWSGQEWSTPPGRCGKVGAVLCAPGEELPCGLLGPEPPAWPKLATHTGISLVRLLRLLWLSLVALELCFLESHRGDFCTEDAKKPSTPLPSPPMEFCIFAAAGKRTLVSVGEWWRRSSQIRF